MTPDLSDITEGWFVGANATVIHLYPNCRCLGRANRVAKTNPQLHPHRDFCDYCVARFEGVGADAVIERGKDANGTCRECYGPLGDDGTCAFCERCDEFGIVNGRHRNARERRRAGVA